MNGKWIGSTTQYWINESNKLYSRLLKKKYKKEKEKGAKLTKEIKKIELYNKEGINIAKEPNIYKFNTKSYTAPDLAVKTTYVHKIPKKLIRVYTQNKYVYYHLPVIYEYQDYIKKVLLKIGEEHKDEIKGNSFRYVITSANKENGSKIVVSTEYTKGSIAEQVKKVLDEKIGGFFNSSYTFLDIGKIEIKIFKPPEFLMGASSTRSIEQANKKWHIVNPSSKFNCVYQSIAVCKNYINNRYLLDDTKKGSEKRIESGKQLKKNVKPKNDNYADDMTIQEICNYTRYPINLYNNVFSLIRSFKPLRPLKRYKKKIKEYNIQKIGDHCRALINKKIMKTYYNDYVFKKMKEKIEEEKKKNEIIKKKNLHHYYNHKIASWDIETSKNSKNEHIPYACAISWFEYEYGDDIIIKRNRQKKWKNETKWVSVNIPLKNITKRTIKEKQFWGLDCLQKMTTWIHDNKQIFNGYTLYAHNGGKYDLPLAVRKAFLDSKEFLIEGKKCLELNNAWIGFTLRSKIDRTYKIYFRDSYRLLPMGLKKLCDELKVEHRKLPETVNHDEITLINYNTFPQLKKYLEHDVKGLLEVIYKFGTSVYKDLGIDITKCYTGASLSKKNYFKNYYDNKKSVYSLSDNNDKIIRNGYFGGRVECFKLGSIKKCYYYDFTSLYPDVGRKELPYDKPEEIKFSNNSNNCNKLPSNFFGHVKCKVKTKNKEAIPKHALLKDNRLIFPIFKNWTNITIFSEEIDYDIYDYIFEYGVSFKKTKLLNKFFTDCFKKKAQSKAANNPAMTQAYKIIANSGYGYWGLRTKDRDGVIICEPNSHEYMEYLNTNSLISIRYMKNYVICRVKKNLEVKDFNVSIASSISSYARSKLHSLLTAIRKVKGNIYYCDTDSVICDINLNDYPDIKKKFQWDGNGNELGSLKNECDEYIEKKLKEIYACPDENNPEFKKNENNICCNKDKSTCIFYKKQKEKFKELLEKENGNFYWDEGVITGCKQYALKKKFIVDEKEYNVEIVKIKGYSQKNKKLNFDDMDNMDKGKNITQIQTQFNCPKSNYVSENKAFIIKSNDVKKSFRKNYTKGQIINNKIIPLEI